MKSLIILALAAMFSFGPDDSAKPTPEDFAIVSDTVENGVRSIVATPSPLVCPKQVTANIDAQTGVIKEVLYVGGCNGNLKAVNALLKGLTVDQALERLDGIQCGKRGTSCTDQLARILKKAYNK